MGANPTTLFLPPLVARLCHISSNPFTCTSPVNLAVIYSICYSILHLTWFESVKNVWFHFILHKIPYTPLNKNNTDFWNVRKVTRTRYLVMGRVSVALSHLGVSINSLIVFSIIFPPRYSIRSVDYLFSRFYDLTHSMSSVNEREREKKRERERATVYFYVQILT